MDTTRADRLRGHDWLPGTEAMATVPALYANANLTLDETVIHLHFFVGSCHWWISEVDEDRRTAFGYANLGDPQNAEWGYVNLDELRGLVGNSHAMPYWVERDLLWTPKPFGQITTD